MLSSYHPENPQQDFRCDLIAEIADAQDYTNCQFFVAMGELSILEQAKKELHVPVIYYHSYRSKGGRAIHLEASRSENKAKFGRTCLLKVNY